MRSPSEQSASSNTGPSSNGTGYNPMQRTIVFDDSTGYVYSPNNLTAAANGGPPVVQDFLTSTSNGWVNAFYQPQADASYSSTQTPVAMPAPTNFQNQSDSPATYVGDKFPRQSRATSGNNWAATVVEYFTGTNTQQSATMQKNMGIGSGNTWEGTANTNGYGANFKGYSMGPAYYGKTFFIWPPDPRWGNGSQAPDPSKISSSDPKKDIYGNFICDWRKRFFCYPTSSSNGASNYRRSAG